jgi:hypothetical protein
VRDVFTQPPNREANQDFDATGTADRRVEGESSPAASDNHLEDELRQRLNPRPTYIYDAVKSVIYGTHRDDPVLVVTHTLCDIDRW